MRERPERGSDRGVQPIRRALTQFATTAIVCAIAATASAQSSPLGIGAGGFVFFGDRVVKESISSTAPVVQVTGGQFFTVALRADGSVVAFGYDQLGQCDIPSGLSKVTQIASGKYHTLFLMSDGTVRAMGSDANNQIDVPAGLNNVQQIAAGDNFSVALKNDGTIVRWGLDPGGLATPVGLTGIVQIAAGEGHMAALKSDHSIVCWGQTSHNECAVPSGPNNFIAVAASSEHTAAVRSDGTIACWGNNDYGQSAPPVGLSNVSAIALGPTHCVALKQDGSLAAWGSHFLAETTVPGAVKKASIVGAAYNTSFAADALGNAYGWGDSSYGESSMPNGFYDVAQVTAGWGHMLMLKHDGSLAGWGDNTKGQLNIPTYQGTPYTQISAGAVHSAAAGTQSIGSSLFGDNGFGQMAVPGSDGSLIDRYWAFAYNTYVHFKNGGVQGFGNNTDNQLALGGNGDFIQIAGGFQHAVGLRSDGTVVTAGNNSYGQQQIPAGLANVTQVAAGFQYSLALLLNQTVVGWGRGDSGQTTPPMGLSGVVQIGAGHVHAVALKSDGTVVAWGGNGSNQAAVPAGLTGIAQIGVGDYYTVCLPNVSLSVAPYSVYGGQNATGTVYIPSPAPVNGLTITLSTTDPDAILPAAVTIPSGATSATFLIETANPVSMVQPVITASFGSLSESSLLTIKPASFSMLTSVPTTVGGSTKVVEVIVKLRTPATAAGATVNLASSDPSVVPPAQVSFTTGQQQKQVPLTISRVHSTVPVTITGSDSDTILPVPFTVTPFQLSSLQVAPGTAVAGFNVNAKVLLNAASILPVDVAFTSSDNTAVTGPITITVPAGSNTTTMPVLINAVAASTAFTLTAKLDGSSITANMTAVPAVTLTVIKPTVVGGSTQVATMSVRLANPAPFPGATVPLTSSDPSVSFSGPATFTTGQQIATITMATSRVHVPTAVTVTAAYGVSTAKGIQNVTPFQIVGFTANQMTLDGGGASTGTVTLNATTANNSVTVELDSSNASAIAGPITATVMPFEKLAPVAIWTTAVATTTVVAVTANIDGSSLAVNLTLQPALKGISIAATKAYGGSMVQGSVQLSVAAPVGGIFVNLTCQNGTVVQPQLIIGAGKTSAIYTVNVDDVTTATQGLVVTATFGPQTLATTSIPIAQNAVTGLTVSPSTFVGNSTTTVTATVTIAAVAAYDLPVQGVSNSFSLASMPQLFIIPAGKKSATVTVSHGTAPTKSTAVLLTANRAGLSKALTITVN